MKIMQIKLNESSGSCYQCQKFFDSFKYLINIQSKYCSTKCLLHYFNNVELKIIWIAIFRNTIFPKKRGEVINKLAERMVQLGW
jgi:hypothetical protein